MEFSGYIPSKSEWDNILSSLELLHTVCNQQAERIKELETLIEQPDPEFVTITLAASKLKKSRTSIHKRINEFNVKRRGKLVHLEALKEAYLQPTTRKPRFKV